MRNVDLFKDYENAKLHDVASYRALHAGATHCFDELDKTDIAGVPICVTRGEDGKLYVTFTPDTHLLAIGATRSGKTTGFVIPAINILLAKRDRPSLVISDPKGELYRDTADKFIKRGYRLILLDFINYINSDCWNPLTKFYRKYQQYLHVEDGVTLVDTPDGPRNRFQGEIYQSQLALDRDIDEIRDGILDEVEKGITALGMTVVPDGNLRDPFWDNSARNLFMAILYGMLEDSADPAGGITEDNFSFDTVLRIFDSFTDADKRYDRGYFTRRDINESRAYQLAHKTIIEQADNTRACIASSFLANISRFRDTAIRRVTSANTFDISSFDDDRPTVVFLTYKDEEGLHYDVISMFLSGLYTELIALARAKGAGLRRPFYFLLDEFGNLPKFNDFDKVISACGSRNIWFLLVLQSYAQLNLVYGKETAEIIRDNMNAHMFFGTNNPETKREFSEECGRRTIIAPTSALNGTGDVIERFEKDTVSLVPVSALNNIQPGECIVTQMRQDVLWSRMERSYLCPEYEGQKRSPAERGHGFKFSDPKYRYNPLARDIN